MSTTVDEISIPAEIEARGNAILEEKWCEFLRGLPAWHFHSLLKGHLELKLHDDFVSGKKSLEQIARIFDEQPQEKTDDKKGST